MPTLYEYDSEDLLKQENKFEFGVDKRITEAKGECINCHVYCGTDGQIHTVGFAPHDEKNIVITFNDGNTKRAIIGKAALAAMLKELSLACEPKICTQFSDKVLLESQLKKAEAKIEELNHEIMKLKEKEE